MENRARTPRLLAILPFCFLLATLPAPPVSEADRDGGHRKRPDVTIVAMNPAFPTASGRVEFRFESQQRGRFECRIDSSRWRRCRSPVSYSELGAGSHTFRVRVAVENRRDRTPAKRTFDVGAATAPDPPAPDPTAPDPPGPGPLDEQLFSPSSPWYAPLPVDAPVDADSPNLTATLMAAVDAQRAAGTGPRLGINSRTTLYRVGFDVPRVPVALDTGPHGAELAAEFSRGVPIPAGARPIVGEDRAMAIYQASTDTYWEFFRMQQALHNARRLGAPVVSPGGELQAGHYEYSVTALNANGESNVDKHGEIPVNVASAGSTVRIAWSTIVGATGYKIYRSYEDGTPGYLATVATPQTTFTDTGAAASLPPPPAVNTATTPGEWRAAYGGVLHGASQSPGYYRDRVSTNGTVIEKSGWGSSATKMPLAAGLVTKADLERGRIDHALSIGLPNSTAATSIIRSGAFAYPAQDSDGRAVGPGAIPEGARLALDPSFDVAQLANPVVRMLAVAARDYGMIVHDGSAGVGIYAEDPASYLGTGAANFYETYAGPRPALVAAQFPWEHLRVVRMRLCSSRPCTAE